MNTPADDNIYPVGASVYAKVNPALPLVIATYNKRIYYCAVVGKPNEKQLAYYEHELIKPDQPNLESNTQ